MYRILIYSFLFFSLDQLSKWLVVFYLQLNTKFRIDLNNQFLNFHMAWNKGINFGLFESESSFQVYFLFLISFPMVIADVNVKLSMVDITIESSEIIKNTCK